MAHVVALFDDMDSARRALRALLERGIARDALSLVVRNEDERYGRIEPQPPGGRAWIGAATGGALGAVAGLLAGAPVWSAAGSPLVLIGPLADQMPEGVEVPDGALLGALIRAGLPEPEARLYVDEVQEDEILVHVSAPSERTAEVAGVLQEHAPVDLDERPSEPRPVGWRGPQPVGPAWDDTDAEYLHGRAGSGPSRAIGGAGQAVTAAARHEPGLVEFGDLEPEYRRHYDRTYAGSGSGWPHYEAGYRFGHDLAMHDRFRGRPWDEVETQARGEWERQNPGTWDRFKGAIAHAFGKGRGER